MRRLAGIGLLALAAGCASGGGTEVPVAAPVRLIVSNALLAPVTIAVDGQPYVSLSSGKSSGLTVASTVRALTWTSAKPTDAQGEPIPDDIGEVRVPVTSAGPELEISNVIDGQTYVTARIFNYTADRVDIGVSDGVRVACAAELPGTTGNQPAFTQIGYYRLLAATELRAYRDGSRCTGTYVRWSSAELARFAPKSGLLYLSLDVAP